MTVNTANTTDTSVDEVDTSTEDESPEAEKDLEESEVAFDDADDTSEDEAEDSEESEDTESEDDSTEDSQDESEEGDDAETLGDDTSPEAKKREAARKAFEQREAARLEKEQSKRESQDEFLDEAKDDTERAFRQLQIDTYNNRVQRNTDTLQNGIDKAAAKIDLLINGTAEEKEAMADALDDFERMYVVRDKNGDPTEVREDVFDYLQRKAGSIRKLTSVGARSRDTAKSNTKARTVAVPTRKPKEGKKDVDLDAFDEEADRW